MFKTLTVAIREFLATVVTKGFLLGILLPPILMGLAITLMPILMNQASPKVEGTVAIIDRTGGTLESGLKIAFDPEKLAAKRAEKNKKKIEQATEVMPMQTSQSKQAMELSANAGGPGPSLTLEFLSPTADAEAEKKRMTESDGHGDSKVANPRLALAVIPETSTTPNASGKFTGYDLFVAPKLDPEIQGDIRDQIAQAVIDQRIQEAGLDPNRIHDLVERPKGETKVVTAEGEKKANEAAAFLLPVGFMMLLWISVFTGGQYLLTSTVEEKSSRVMEVLLSAVSPMQLMVGKIVGQMAVSFVILSLYMGAGVIGLIYANQGHLLELVKFVYVGIYFLIAFFLIASMMAAIGSAVNDMREAQALLGPVMIALIIPMMLWLPLSRNPNSMFAQICSFVPPISPFVMVIRIAGSEKIPFWQIPASIAVGLLAVWFAAWAAAKIFRVGVLMYGKPPNFPTLIRWIRMA